MMTRKVGLAGVTAVAALFALAPAEVSTGGIHLRVALADGGDNGKADAADRGGKDADKGGSVGDGADAGKAGGGGNSAGNPSGVSGTEGNQGNAGTMGNAGGAGRGASTETADRDKGKSGGAVSGPQKGNSAEADDDDDNAMDDDDNDTQVGSKPSDGKGPVGNAFGRDRQGNAAPTRDEPHARAADLLGNLNAAHASPNARANAAPNSMVGQIATYEASMRQAMAISDPNRRDAAVIAAREQLALAANKPLTSDVIQQVDAMLGIRDVSPQLGALR